MTPIDPRDPKQQGKRLGRGLDGLIGPAASTPRPAARDASHAAIEDIHPSRGQPRKRFDDAKLAELAQSIKELGVLEPILVRRRKEGGYELIAGERRWRAAGRAGLREIPIFVRDELTAKDAFEAQIVENLQREDLNPIETARALQKLIDEHGHTQETVAQRIGKDRATIANAIRLLKLPAQVLEKIERGELSEGHGRALLGAPSPASMLKLAASATTGGWSVRETERQVRGAAKSGGSSAGGEKGAPGKTTSANVRDLENRLSKSLGARVSIADRKGKGKVEITFTSYAELDRLLEKLL